MNVPDAVNKCRAEQTEYLSLVFGRPDIRTNGEDEVSPQMSHYSRVEH